MQKKKNGRRVSEEQNLRFDDDTRLTNTPEAPEPSSALALFFSFII